MPTADELAQLLVERLLDERPEGAGLRVVPVLNGLGSTKYEELFVVYRRIAGCSPRPAWRSSTRTWASTAPHSTWPAPR